MTALPDGTPLLNLAHIVSLDPAGPRSDPNQASDAVSDFPNLLLVCASHHQEIDMLPSIYTVEKLRRMHDRHMRRVAGSPLPPLTIEDVPELPQTGNPLQQALRIWNRERGNSSEEFWQALFGGQPTLLAAATHGMPFALNSKCYVGGKSVDNHGGNVVDFLAQSSDAILVEIKTPTTKLLGSEYRSNVFPPSRELVGAVAQALHYRLSLIQEIANLRMWSPQLIAHHPPMIVIIGDKEREGWSYPQQRSFELYRSSQKDVLIRTYDELFRTVADFAEQLTSDLEDRPRPSAQG